MTDLHWLSDGYLVRVQKTKLVVPIVWVRQAALPIGSVVAGVAARRLGTRPGSVGRSSTAGRLSRSVELLQRLRPKKPPVKKSVVIFEKSRQKQAIFGSKTPKMLMILYHRGVAWSMRRMGASILRALPHGAKRFTRSIEAGFGEGGVLLDLVLQAVQANEAGAWLCVPA